MRKRYWVSLVLGIVAIVSMVVAFVPDGKVSISSEGKLSVDTRVALAAQTGTMGNSGLVPQEQYANSNNITFVAEPPIVFSETSDYIKLGFTTFTVEFYKGTYGYNKVYDRSGNVLVYDDRAVVEYWKANKWSQRGVPYSLTWKKLDYNGDRVDEYYYEVSRHYTDYLGTTYTLTYMVKSGEAMKLSVTLNSGQTDTYRIAWYLSGIQKTIQKTETTRLVFGNEAVLYDWVAFDWNDVYDSMGNITSSSTEVKADGIKASIYFNVGNVKAGQSITLDPSYVAAGAIASGTGAVTPALPAGIQTNDILLLFAESDTNEAVTIADSKGGTWTEVTGSPQNSTASRLTVFWSRYNGTQTAPVTNDPGDHICAAIVAWRGCITTGNPWNITSSGVDNNNGTSVSIPGATTTVTNCLVIAIVGHGRDSAKESVNLWANASLSDLVERVDYCTSSGGGGGFGIAEGGKAAAGAYNATTATLAAASTKGLMTIALKPPDLDVGADAIDRATTGVAALTWVDKNNPANASGTLHTIEIWAQADISGLIVGIFYLTGTNRLKCRDSESIAGTITAGSKVTKTVSITVVEGDYIGCYFASGTIERSTAGFAGIWYVSGEYIDPNDEMDYTFFADYAISLYGYGDIAVGNPPTMTTNAASNLNYTSVQGNGSIDNLNEGGNCTMRGFKYGLTQADTWSVSENGDFGTGSYDLNILDLQPDTSYWYRAFATNPGGTGYGSYVQFATLAYNIGNTPGSWEVNGGAPVLESSEYATGLDHFTVTNYGLAAVDISIKGTDMAGGGYTWVLSDTATRGNMIYGLKAGLAGGDYTIIVRKTLPFNMLVEDLVFEASQEWGLKLYTPMVFDDGNAKTGTVTLTATLN